MTCFFKRGKKPSPACQGRGRGESSLGAAAGPGLRTPAQGISRRVVAPGWAGALGPLSLSVGSLCPARSGSKSKNALDWRSTRVFAFPWHGGSAASNRGRRNQRSRSSYPDSQRPARPKPRYNAKSRVEIGDLSTRVFVFAGRGGPMESKQGRKQA